MKRLFLFAALTFASLCNSNLLKAQYYGQADVRCEISKDTSFNADTVVAAIIAVKSNVESFSCTVTKLSGTVTGYVLLQGSNITGSWDDISTDTLVLSNKTVEGKTWKISGTVYLSYRAWYKSTGTQKSILKFCYLRHNPEEKQEQ